MIKEDKYLPIGTICSIKFNSNLFMIVGYQGTTYENDEVVNYDYVGVIYPSGTLQLSKLINFNHTDIDSVVFIGYKNTTYELFNSSMVNDHNEVITYQEQIDNVVDTDTAISFKFDENGIVVLDNTTNYLQPSNYSFDENGFVVDDRTTKNPFVNSMDNVELNSEENVNNWDIFKNVELHENIIEEKNEEGVR